jgi:hypothetical protein
MYRASSSAAAGAPFGDFFDNSDFDKTPHLVRDGGFVEAKTLGYSDSADPRILPDRPDYPGGGMRPDPSPSRHFNPL